MKSRNSTLAALSGDRLSHTFQCRNFHHERGHYLPETNLIELSKEIDLSKERAARADRARDPGTCSGPPAPEDLELHVRHLWVCSRELRQAIAAGDQETIADMIDEIDLLQHFGPTSDFQARCAATLQWASAESANVLGDDQTSEKPRKTGAAQVLPTRDDPRGRFS
ncbi:hypothetical protein Sa4125_38900 [Aureimonas sp. SA4125]|uniref:hypothetical protein n=1 Tax=Aureimonas sp. SA4125 TaxID=2826993 RepID=UPI001CC62067|nr:hypothetical protein [Aureimonas sp. SA4125]BDA86348.1 hypothetical protein Sa4125_38900 [Aureimonas sp. SA4125]